MCNDVNVYLFLALDIIICIKVICLVKPRYFLQVNICNHSEKPLREAIKPK